MSPSPRIRMALIAFAALLVVPVAAAVLLIPGGPEVRPSPSSVPGSRPALAPRVLGDDPEPAAPSGPGYRILTVKVLDDGGDPIGGAKVWVEGLKGRSAQTASDGTATLQGVSVKSLVVRVTSKAHRSGREEVGAGDSGETTTVELRLQKAAPVSGRVLNAEGYPAAGAIVRCVGVVNGEALTTKADEDGNFTLSPSADGCDLVASMRGVGPSETQPAKTGVEITLRLRKLGSIAGTVEASDGGSVAGAVVGVELYVPASEDFNARLRKKTRADAAGAFVLSELPPGRYVLTATGRGAAPAKSDPIELEVGEERRGVRLSFDDGAKVDGRVTDAETGRPIAGVILRLQGISLAKRKPKSVRSDEDGRFEIPGAPEDMPFSVRAQAKGYNIRLVSGLSAGRSVDITLNPADGRPRKEVPTTGITIRAAGDGLDIIRVDPNSSAAKAGVLVNDKIVSIDGRSAQNMTHMEAMQRLRGEPGTSVSLELLRGEQRKSVSVERELLIN